jgi:phospholipid/cholesterol/gamma-HCH transport system substrate-binding protein
MRQTRPPSMRIGPYAARVAVISALALALAAALLLIAAARDTYEVRAVFDDVRGLIPGGDVTAGSIVVGTVTEVELNDEGDPEVTMEITDDFRLHRGAFADIRLGSNVGAVNRVVDLTEGDPSAPELADGSTLAGRQTDNPVNFDLAVSTLTPRVRAQIKRVLIGLDRALAERGPDLARTLRHSSTSLNETANLLAEVNADGESMRRLVAEGSRVVSALAESPQDLGEAAERTALLLRVTGARQEELRASTRSLGPSLASTRELLERAEASVPTLRTLVAGAGPVVDELGPFARIVPDAGRAAAPFLAETRRLVRAAPGQLRAQRPLLRVGPPTVRELVPLIDRLNPIADELRVWTPETVGFFQNAADSAANYDANGHMVRITTTAANTLPPSAGGGGAIGSSDCRPGLLEPPFHRTPGIAECDPWEEWPESRIGSGG